jgi:hypothetical protein
MREVLMRWHLNHRYISITHLIAEFQELKQHYTMKTAYWILVYRHTTHWKHRILAQYHAGGLQDVPILGRLTIGGLYE